MKYHDKIIYGNKKYIMMTDRTNMMVYNEKELYRIIAIKTFGNVKAGEKGGWIEGTHNLSEEGNCWVANQAIAMDNVQVIQDAQLLDFSLAQDNVIIADNFIMRHTSRASDNVVLRGEAEMTDCSSAKGKVVIEGKVKLIKDSSISGIGTVMGEGPMGDSVVLDWQEIEVYKRPISVLQYPSATQVATVVNTNNK